ncbi:hypothetical protein [Geobacter grbiciae]|uniref:hypothetical protein n=1 Tax=Geobacter grbiciae TaxID=155042 RepID=UPI001C03075F|nr:hypothetical protein [Geobacter grbiciae]MBT1074477.1 hypothetical protein [Geobacter grbiciae]
MKSAVPLLLLSALLISIPVSVYPQASSMPAEEIGTVRLGGSAPCFDTRVRRELDSFVSRLATLDSGRVVKIEANASWGANREERVRNSLLLALEAHRYLRTRLRSGLNLYIAAASNREAEKITFIRVVSFPDSFATVHVSTVGNRQP